MASLFRVEAHEVEGDPERDQIFLNGQPVGDTVARPHTAAVVAWFVSHLRRRAEEVLHEMGVPDAEGRVTAKYDEGT